MCQKTEYTPAKIGEYSRQVIFPSDNYFKSSKLCMLQKRVKDNKPNSLYLMWTYARILLCLWTISILSFTQSSQALDPSCVLKTSMVKSRSILNLHLDQYMMDFPINTWMTLNFAQHLINSQLKVSQMSTDCIKGWKIADYHIWIISYKLHILSTEK